MHHLGGNFIMFTRAQFGSTAARSRTHLARRFAAVAAAVALTGTLTFAGLPVASAEESVDPVIAAGTQQTVEPEPAPAAPAQPDAAPVKKPEEAAPKATEEKVTEDKADESAEQAKTEEPNDTGAAKSEPEAIKTEDSQPAETPKTDQAATEVPQGDPGSPAVLPEDQTAELLTSTEPELGALTDQGQKTTKPEEGSTTAHLVIVKAVLPAGSDDLASAQPGGAGWPFAVSSAAATVEAPSAKETDANSQAAFLITVTEGRTAPVTVTETVRDGYSYVTAQCYLVKDGKQSDLSHKELGGAAFKVEVKTKKTTVCVVYNRPVKEPFQPLTAEKTANPVFDRDYDWTVEKSVVGDRSARVVAGGTATFSYRVVATPSAAQDSNFRVVGTITITNSNKTAVPVTVTDDLGIEGASCTIAGADGAIVPAAGAEAPGVLALDYECRLPQNASASTAGENTAIVTWEGGQATATAGFAFSAKVAVETDRIVKLSDTAAEFGGSRKLDALDGQQVFTYSRTLGEGVAAGACQIFPNTASIPETTDQPKLTDDADVEVCAEAVTKPTEPTAPTQIAPEEEVVAPVLPETVVKGAEEEETEAEAETLAYTGSESGQLLNLAALAVISGAVLTWVSRRRRDRNATI